MGLLNFKCEICEYEIKKIKKISDIFNIKKGKLIICESCESTYKVLDNIEEIGKIYNFLLWGGLILIPYLSIVYFLDKFYKNFDGWVWLIALIIYIFIEYLITLLLPLKIQNKEKK